MFIDIFIDYYTLIQHLTLFSTMLFLSFNFFFTFGQHPLHLHDHFITLFPSLSQLPRHLNSFLLLNSIKDFKKQTYIARKLINTSIQGWNHRGSTRSRDTYGFFRCSVNFEKTSIFPKCILNAPGQSNVFIVLFSCILIKITHPIIFGSGFVSTSIVACTNCSH
jgi:hypothetical protein